MKMNEISIQIKGRNIFPFGISSAVLQLRAKACLPAYSVCDLTQIMQACIIEHTTWDGLPLIRLSSPEHEESIEILPQTGALWHSWTCLKNGIPHKLISGYPDAASLGRDLSSSYRSAKLSPFVCRLKDGTYEHEGYQYEISHKFPDGNAIHGLVFDRPFQLMDQGADSRHAWVNLRHAYRGTDPGYPFWFDCDIRYEILAAGGLRIATTITNCSEGSIPIVDGWHPYFSLGVPVDACTLQFPPARMLEFDERLLPTGRYLDAAQYESGRSLKGIELDNSFLLKPGYSGPACRFSHSDSGLALEVFFERNYPILQVYIPPDRNSLAIECLSGAPDAFNNHLGLDRLGSGHSMDYTVRYLLNQANG